MANIDEQTQHHAGQEHSEKKETTSNHDQEMKQNQDRPSNQMNPNETESRPHLEAVSSETNSSSSHSNMNQGGEVRPMERPKAPARPGARGTAAMDPKTRQEVARKGGLAVSRNKQHMAEIGRKGGQTVSKNREHMARIGRKGGAASRGHR